MRPARPRPRLCRNRTAHADPGIATTCSGGSERSGLCTLRAARTHRPPPHALGAVVTAPRASVPPRSARTWFCKPAPVSPLNCARRGWENLGVDRLGCESCSATLTFAVKAGLSAAERKIAADKFAGKLESGHDDLCPWRGKTCNVSLAAFPPLSQAVIEVIARGRPVGVSALPAVTASSPTPPRTQARFRSRVEAIQGASALLEIPALAPAAVARIAETHRRSLGMLVQQGALRQHSLEVPESPRDPRKGAEHGEGAARNAGTPAADSEPLQAATADATGAARLLALCGWDLVAPGLTSEPGASLPDATTPPQLRCGLCGAKRVLRTRLEVSGDRDNRGAGDGARAWSAGEGHARPAPPVASADAIRLRDLGRTIAGGDPSQAVVRAARLGLISAAPFGSRSVQPAFGPATPPPLARTRPPPVQTPASAPATVGAVVGEVMTPRMGPPVPRRGREAEEATAMDPLAAHRPFCPVVVSPVGEEGNYGEGTYSMCAWRGQEAQVGGWDRVWSGPVVFCRDAPDGGGAHRVGLLPGGSGGTCR